MSVRTYAEALNYLYSNLPIFQRVGASAYKADLTNTIALCEELDNPQNKFKSVHIAGTNGKGSSSHMLASVLQSAGYKTGLYTSPHLKEFTERIRINGDEISQEFVVDFVNRIQNAIERIKPSFFEITVVMAFDYFVKSNIDVAVIEVGLGGRLDSTNVINPVVSLITNIGWDHKDILGDTLEKIASEKAGIIKYKTPVVVSQRQADVEDVFIAKAQVENAELSFASDEFNATIVDTLFHVTRHSNPYLNLKLPLTGQYQQRNLPGVLKTIDALNHSGFKISEESIVRGLENTIDQTHLKGRWQKLGDRPLMICDTGHNIDGVREVFFQIKTYRYRNLHVVWGAVKDKDIRDILALLPKDATYYFCQAKIPRAMNADTLAELAQQTGLSGGVIPDVNEAIAEARKNAGADDMIFIGGSTFVVAEINGL